MNRFWQARLGTQLVEYVLFAMRKAGRRCCYAFGSDSKSLISCVYVINIDRRADRLSRVRQELMRVCDGRGVPLATVTRRHRGVDWRDPHVTGEVLDVSSGYTLAEQLFVQPVAALGGNEDAAAIRIQMTAQEVAVAQSHVEVWRRVAEGHDEYALILEDDAYFTRRFASDVDSLWRVLFTSGQKATFELLLLSFAEVDGGAQKIDVLPTHFRPASGLWQLSGYVLSKQGAQHLLEWLPVRGPVDLWINHQFANLNVFASRRSLIRQRPGGTSSNNYSVLPTLTGLGVLSENKASRAKQPTSAIPIFASGPPGSGLPALSTALSMLGYRCCSAVDKLPAEEHARVMRGGRRRVFDAYVDVNALTATVWPELAQVHPGARFIETVSAGHDVSPGSPMGGQPRLVLPDEHPDKWQALVEYLGCDYPAHAFPYTADQRRRLVVADAERVAGLVRPLRWDQSPWIIPTKKYNGFSSPDNENLPLSDFVLGLSDGTGGLDERHWRVRDDTFPGNLCLFRPENVYVHNGSAEIALRAEAARVRQFTSGAIACQSRQTYGRYVALIKPSAAPGVVTGMFLHRDVPRQEIDIEFLGSHPTSMLVNVYYNPGQEGTRLQHGYRGTPVLVDLGFDASADYHEYEIDWLPSSITWRVDGKIVYRRQTWSPTPVPDLPAEFNLNLWHPRSVELAGRLKTSALPTTATFKEIVINYQ